MRRARVGFFLLACGLAGTLAAAVLAAGTPASIFTTGTTVTTTAPTTTVGPPPPPPPRLVASGVTIAGVPVSGLTAEDARLAVRARFAERLNVIVARRRLTPTPGSLGAVAYVDGAVARALAAPPRTDVPLVVRVRGDRVRAYVAKLARHFDRTPVNSALFLRHLRPFVTKERSGRALDRRAATTALVRALRSLSRAPVRLRLRAAQPEVTRRTFGPVIVIRRGSNRLYLYSGMRLRRVFGVATGEARYPTPLGRFSIVAMWRNPWWYPPNSDWARGKEPIPPGPGNPLGTRWMGLSVSGVGIHGTPDAASIGYSVSHGCIRMRIPDAEWLFGRVTVGTTVFIVAA